MAGRRKYGCLPTSIHPLKYWVQIMLKKYSFYLKYNTKSRVHRPFAVDFGSRMKGEHTVGKMQTILTLKQMTCVATAGDNSPKSTRSVLVPSCEKLHHIIA
jgi:hypothetical protein